jgi:hypothetical protein
MKIGIGRLSRGDVAYFIEVWRIREGIRTAVRPPDVPTGREAQGT